MKGWAILYPTLALCIPCTLAFYSDCLLSSHPNFKATTCMVLQSTRFFSLKQAANLDAVAALRQVYRKPTLLIPSLQIASIDQLNLVDLKRMGVKYLVFDKDNTLSLCYSAHLHPSAIPVVSQARELFFDNLAILSNSAGSSDDFEHRMAEDVERATGLKVIRHQFKKPKCHVEVVEHFQSLNDEQVSPSEICVIGDRLMTDVLFANSNGMKSVLVGPISFLRDHPVAMVVRLLEYALLPIIRRIWGTRK